MLAGGAGLVPAAAGSHGQAFWKPHVVQVCSQNSDVQRPCHDPGSLALEMERGVSGEQPCSGPSLVLSVRVTSHVGPLGAGGPQGAPSTGGDPERSLTICNVRAARALDT